METNYDFSWLDEQIEHYPGYPGLYKFFCFLLLKRRMKYSDLYVLIYALHKKNYKDNELVLKEKIINDLAAIYLYNNNKLPDGFEFIRQEI